MPTLVIPPARQRSAFACLVLGAALLAPTMAAGQTFEGTTRTAVLDTERDKKATETTPPRRSAVEKALYWYDNQYVLPKIFGGWNGIHFAGGDFPAGAGMKFGVGFSPWRQSAADQDRSNRFDLQTVAARSTRGYTRAAAAIGVHRLAGKPLDLRVRGQYYEYPQEDFFGLGQDSQSDNRTSYLFESKEAGAELEWKPAKMIDLSGGVSFVRPTTGSGTDSRYPSTEQLFDAATLPGFGARTDFVRADASVAFDWRDNPLHPHAGGRYSVQLSDFRDQDLDAFAFQRIQLDVQQYVPLPNHHRIIALRVAAVLTDPYANQQVPFYYQPTLGGAQALRGFREFRFRDRNSLLLTAEYRWEASWMLDGALFVDAGKVAADRKDLNFENLDVSYGVGFRVHSNRAFVTRLDLAFSREGFIPLLRFEHVF